MNPSVSQHNEFASANKVLGSAANGSLTLKENITQRKQNKNMMKRRVRILRELGIVRKIVKPQ